MGEPDTQMEELRAAVEPLLAHIDKMRRITRDPDGSQLFRLAHEANVALARETNEEGK